MTSERASSTETTGASPPAPASEEEDGEATLRMLELGHRMKNVLAIIQSLVNQTLRSGRDMEEARRALNDRLVAMGKGVDMLLHGGSAPGQLRAMIEGALSGDGGRIVIEGPDVAVGPDAALSLSLVFHELESNALKYGALSNDTGGVEVSWHVEEKDGACCLKLQWREQGGPPVAPPSRQGFGSRLISKAIGRRFNGKSEAEFAPEGLRWRLSASLEALAN